MSTVEQIKEKLNVADVIGRYIKLEKAGANMKAKCPFHQEKTPSFFVSPSRGSYYCFGCGAKGDIFTFIEEFEHLDFMGSLKVLAEMAGVPIVYERKEDQQEKTEKEKLFSIMEEATDFYLENLAKHSEVVEYLSKRGLKEKAIKNWRLGFAPEGWQNLLDHLKSKSFQENNIEKAGLIKQGEKGKDFYDRFRARIMFPIFDPSGRPIGFSGRLIDDNNKEAKYVNSPEGPLFNKSKVLYGYDRAKNAIREKNYTILVEGQLDLLMMHQASLENTVASSGTALTEEHLKLLNRISPNLLLAYDGDGAGLKAALRAWYLALSMGMEVKIAEMPKGEDPASLILKDATLMKTALKNTKHIINFYLDRLLTETEDKRKLAKAVEKEILPLVRSLSSSVDQAHFIKVIADKTNLPEVALYEELNKIQIEEIAGSLPEKVVSRDDFLTRRLWGLIFWQEKQSQPSFNLSETKAKIEKITGGEALKKWDNMDSADKSNLIFEAEIYYQGNPNLAKETDELVRQLEKDYLKLELERTIHLLQQAEKGKDESKISELLKRCHELSTKLN